MFDIKLSALFETEVTQRIKEGQIILPDPVLIDSKIMSKKADFEALACMNYFNFRLNFYEPFIEKFGINSSYASDKESKNISFELDNNLTLNLNLSTSLFENVLLLVSYINDSMEKHGFKESGGRIKPQSSILDLENNRKNYEYKYSLENLTGEELLIATHEDDEFLPVYANQVIMLDFTNKYDELGRSAGPDLKHRKKQTSTAKSPYRKENFRIENSFDQRTKKIQLSIPSLNEDPSAFDEENENFERLTIDIYELQNQKCIKLYVGHDKNHYILCHEQKSINDQRKIILRSPIQIRNTLKCPIEVKLTREVENTVEDSKEETKASSDSFKLYLSPDSSKIVPLKAMNFESFQLRPISLNPKRQESDLLEEERDFSWSEEASFKLHSLTEKQLFQMKPFYMK